MSTTLRRRTGPAPTPLNMTRVIALRDQGVSYEEIGKRLGTTGTVVWRAVRRFNQDAAEASQQAAG